MPTIAIYPCTDVSAQLTPEDASLEHWANLVAIKYLIGSSDAGYTADWFLLDYPIASGTIDQVVIVYSACVTSGSHHARVQIKNASGTIVYTSTPQLLTASYTMYSITLATNPGTGVAWTWADFSLYSFSIELDSTAAYCNSLLANVTFTHAAGTLYIGSGSYRTNWFGFSGDDICLSGNWIRSSASHGPVVVAIDGSVVWGTGSISGGWSADPVIYGTGGTVEIVGNSSTQKITIKEVLGTGIQLMTPSNCLVQDVVTQDCRSGTSTVPVVGDASLGMGVWLNGAGSGNVLRRVTAKRCGIHGIQVYGSDNNVLDYIDVDGVYGYFGLSLYQTDGTTASNVTTANTRREGVNLMQCTGSSLTDFAVRNGQTDYGVSDYLCDGSTIQRGTIDRTHKDGLAIVGSDNGQYDHIVITKACQGRYIGHYAGIMLEGSDSVGCENNIVEWCTIEDLDHRQIFNIKEVAYIPSGTNLTNSNIIRNNRCYGAIRGPVRTVGSLSTQSNNGVIEIV